MSSTTVSLKLTDDSAKKKNAVFNDEKLKTGQKKGKFEPMNVDYSKLGDSDQEGKIKKQQAIWNQDLLLDYDKSDPVIQMILGLEIEPLDFDKDILDDFTIMLFGRRRIGKSWAMRWILWNLRFRMPFGIVITNTKINKFWSQYIPDEFIHPVRNMEMVLEEVFKRQEFIEEHPELGIDPRMFVLLDDVLRDKTAMRYSDTLRTLFTDGRHYKLMTIIGTQYAKGLPPDIRGNVDLSIIFKQYQFQQRESIVEDFLDIVPKKQVRYALLDNNTGGKTEEEKHRGLCVISAKLSNELPELLRSFHSEEPPENFKVGCKEFWLSGISGNLSLIQHTRKNPPIKKMKPAKFRPTDKSKIRELKLKRLQRKNKLLLEKRKKKNK